MKRTKKGLLHRWSRPIRPMLLLIPTIIVAMLMVAGSTLAWFMSTDGVRNNLKGDKHTFSILAVDEFTVPNMSQKMPGADFPKTVGATNTGTLPGFVRLLVEPIVFTADPDDRSQPSDTPLPCSIGQEIHLDIDTANWKLGEDGWYYYLGVLQPGKTAPPLFTTVTLDPGLDTDYRNAHMKIEVKCEGVDIYKGDTPAQPETWHYRVAWWENPSAPPSAGELGDIETLLSSLAQ